MAKRDFTKHIIDPKDVGPVGDFGKWQVEFKSKQPLTAVIALFDDTTNALDRERNYLREAAIDTEENRSNLEQVLGNIEASGLDEIVKWLTEEYTTFPTTKPDGSSL
jgi:hypothetical protein